MATATDIHDRTLATLKTVELMLDDLAAVAGDWPTLSQDERMSWSLDWSNEMSGLERVARAAAARQVPPAIAARFDDVARRLAEVTPVLDRLDLYRPCVPLRAA